jgi:rod shape-determining protein MreC
VAFAGGGMNTPSARDTAPGGRFIFFAVVSLVLMYFDQRDGWGAKVRYVLQAVAYPIQVTVGSPGRLINATSEMIRTRASLREENEALKTRDRELELRTQRFEALERENEQLRGLAAGSLPPLVTKSALVDVIKAELTLYRQRLVINEGDNSGLFRSQAVVDATGLVGQLVRVGPWSAEVMVITDPEAEVPVEFLRSGDARELLLPDVLATADVKEGDLVMTSGLGGVFPTGIAVGQVVKIERDPDEIVARVIVQPSARLDRSRQLLALWFDPANPAAPWRPEMVDTLPAASIADPVTREPSTAKPAGANAEPAPRKPAPQAGPHPPAARPATVPAPTPAPTTAAEKPAATPEPAEPAQ